VTAGIAAAITMAKAGSGLAIGSDTKAVLLAAGLIFIGALLLGVWKYRQMAASPEGLAHPYVDTAHRAALLYSFATLLIATFVELSGWSTAVNVIAAFAIIAFFLFAISSYIWHGARRDTDNQFREGEESPGLHPFMWALIVVEIAGFGVLLAGFVSEQLL
jgi:DMSO/TMAO reductase YedYZ heme-binding membrane subunit